MSYLTCLFSKTGSGITKRDFWKKGSGEVTGFMVVTPVIAFFLVTFISVIQVGMIHSRLEYAAYAVCRAAVVSEDDDEAKERGKKALDMNMADVSESYDKKTLKFNLVLHEVDKSVVVVGKNGRKSSAKKMSMGKSKGWEKGSYVTCRVSCDVKTLSDLVIGTNPNKTAEVTMMIERGNSITAKEIADQAYPD